MSWNHNDWPAQGWDDPDDLTPRPRHRILLVSGSIIVIAGVVVAIWLSLMLRSRTSVVRAAQAWSAAVTEFDSERIAELSCLEAPAPTQIVLQLFGVLEAGGATIPLPADWSAQLESLLPRLGEYITLDAGQLEYALLSSTDSNAYIRVSGPLRVGIWRIFIPVEVNQNWYMHRENGSWKWCGWDDSVNGKLHHMVIKPRVTPIHAADTHEKV